jgi:hypothetical protein
VLVGLQACELGLGGSASTGDERFPLCAESDQPKGGKLIESVPQVALGVADRLETAIGYDVGYLDVVRQVGEESVSDVAGL